MHQVSEQSYFFKHVLPITLFYDGLVTIAIAQVTNQLDRLHVLEQTVEASFSPLETQREIYNPKEIKRFSKIVLLSSHSHTAMAEGSSRAG